MPKPLTIRNIPVPLLERLWASAAANRRSVSAEAICCLEQALLPTQMSTEERLARARALRAELGAFQAHSRDIGNLKLEGRAT